MASRLPRTHLALLGFSMLAFACSKASSKFNLSHPHKERQLIVIVEEGQRLDKLASLNGTPEVKRLNAQTALLTFATDLDLEAAAEEIAAQKGVQSVEANQIYTLSEKTPNDPDFGRLFGLKNSGQSGGTAGADIGAARAWDVTTGSSDVVIGVIDSGIDYNHPDLERNIWTNPGENGLDSEGRDKRSNGVDDDANGFIDDFRGWDFFNNDNNPMDDNSHGTHVSGTIGAAGDNATGVVGVNWNVSLVPIKVFSGGGSTSTDILVSGIQYATKVGVFASNNSWGGGGFSDAIFNAIKAANERGSIFVAAAGNASTNHDVSAQYPSDYDVPNIISVASTNRRDELSSFSDFGRQTVDIAAPGEDIYSTVPGGGYGVKSGTSMASPHVTGVVALLKARFPDIGIAGVKEKLFASATKIPRLATAVIKGRLDAAGALEEDSIAPSAVAGLTIQNQGLTELTISWDASGDDGEEGSAATYLARLSAQAIASDEEWAAAEEVILVDSVSADGRVTAKITGLAFNRQGFVTLKAADNVGNVGAASESSSFALTPVAIVFEEANNADHAWASLDSPWASMTVDDVSYMSDSPAGAYTSSMNASVTSADFDFGATDLVLNVRMKYEFESKYDFGFIEVSTDQGATWKQVSKFTGSSALTTHTVSLSPQLVDKSAFRVRFRTQTDFSINKNGWDIDSIQIVGPQQ